MKHQNLLKEIAHFESVNDHLITEITFIDRLLRQSGFPHGLESLKAVAFELLREEDSESGKFN